MAGRATLPGQPAPTGLGQRGLPGETSQRQHGCHQLEGAEAAGLLPAELLQVSTDIQIAMEMKLV